MWILHKLVHKVWPNFSLEFGGEIGYSRNYGQWHIIVHDHLLLLSLLAKNFVHVIFGEMLEGNYGKNALKIFRSQRVKRVHVYSITVFVLPDLVVQAEILLLVVEENHALEQDYRPILNHRAHLASVGTKMVDAFLEVDPSNIFGFYTSYSFTL
jgi:hypothetical protein